MLILLLHTSNILAFQRSHHTQGTASFLSNNLTNFSSFLYTFSPSASSKKIDMEDRNILAADCIIICCCCQCMILQILIFLLLKLPQKLLRKAKYYAKKLRTRKRGTKNTQIAIEGYEEDSMKSHGNNSFRIDTEGFSLDGSLPFPGCMDETERVLVDFSNNKGEFCFGSFWCGDDGSRSLSWCLKQDEIDYDYVRSHLIEVFGSSTSLSSHSDFHEKHGVPMKYIV